MTPSPLFLFYNDIRPSLRTSKGVGWFSVVNSKKSVVKMPASEMMSPYLAFFSHSSLIAVPQFRRSAVPPFRRSVVDLS